jgi:SAM-dependent methyltransferase
MKLGDLYEKFYRAICGNHPTYYPWHFQWHFLRETHQWKKKNLKTLSGNILDIGCGNKPYSLWFDQAKIIQYIGLDVIESPEVDVVVKPAERWPFKDGSFDCIMMTQTLEHLENPNHTLAELKRVLKPEGVLVLTVPFIYPVHGEPYDFKRYTTYGLNQLFSKDFHLKEVKGVGKLGSVLATLLLTNIENNLNLTFAGRIAKGLLLPLWVLFSFLVNIVCLPLNWIDCSSSHYCNSCVLAVKK